MKQRSAQAIVLYAMDLEPHLGQEFPIEAARETFLREQAWQPARRYLERLAATPDWAEVLIAANLCFEPVVATLIRRELGTRAAAAHGDTVTPVLARVETQEWEWARAWTVALAGSCSPTPSTARTTARCSTGWVRDWLPQALAAAAALAPVAAPIGLDVERADRARPGLRRRDARRGRPARAAAHWSGYEPAGSRGVPARASPKRRARRPGPSGSARQQPQPTSDSEGSFDFVGIVMAKSAEGDAVAALPGAARGDRGARAARLLGHPRARPAGHPL